MQGPYRCDVLERHKMQVVKFRKKVVNVIQQQGHISLQLIQCRLSAPSEQSAILGCRDSSNSVLKGGKNSSKQAHP